MRIEVKTIADRPLYRRVPSTREAVNKMLTDQLIEMGVDPDTIEIQATDLPQGGRCCPITGVIAYGTKPDKKKSTKVNLDD